MGVIRIVTGTGSGPTETAAYDAALAAANVHNYNLVTVSSVIPADGTVKRVEEAPDLGPAGQRLTVVEGKASVTGPGVASASLAWTTGDGPGLFYESAGPTDPRTVETRAREGIEAGLELRDWTGDGIETATATTEVQSGAYACAVVLAVYGTGESIW